MTRGDLYTVEIPSSDGHEQAGTRPAIVVQAAQLENQLPTVLIVPLTSQLAAQTFPGTFLVQPDSDNGLTALSVALVFPLRAIDKRRLGPSIQYYRRIAPNFSHPGQELAPRRSFPP